MIDILLVDDHALFRESLSRLLSSVENYHIAGQCSTVDEAIALMNQRSFDLILLDFELGDRRGNEVVSMAATRGYARQILIVTVGLTHVEIREMIKQGVGGIVLKNNSPEQLIQAIEIVSAGGRWMDPRYKEFLTTGQGSEEFRRAKFTDRDRQVLRSVFEGLSNKEIAEKLGVSESAIKASLQQLFSKTGVRTRGQLVRIALEQYRRELI